MLPNSPSDPSLTAPNRAGASSAEDARGEQDQSHAGAKDPLAPIGRARLEALREAIQNGTYPSEDVVVRGLERLLHGE